jgi:hypothetical protein
LRWNRGQLVSNLSRDGELDMRRIVVFGLLLTTAAPSLARAQNACADLPKFFARAPRIGEWAEMAWHKEGKPDPERMRIAVVKAEQRQGKQMYWFQMAMSQAEGGRRTIMQMLTPWDATSLQGTSAVEVVMKIGDQRAMKMSSEMGKSAASKGDWREFCADSKFLGEESVTVPAGTFKTRHYTGPHGDTWASMDAPVWHLVKMTSKEGGTMTLSATGTGAKNEITEEPVDMKAMMADPEAMRKMSEEMEKANKKPSGDPK